MTIIPYPTRLLPSDAVPAYCVTPKSDPGKNNGSFNRKLPVFARTALGMIIPNDVVILEYRLSVKNCIR